MTKKDLLHRFIFDKAPIRGEFVQLEESFQTIVNQHQYPESIRKLLGEALCVAALLSAIIKFEGRLTVQFRGQGHLKLLLVQCNNQFHLRGLVNWEGDLSYDELMQSFNDGVLAIMLDFGVNKNRYQGIVAWQGNSLAESIEGYFKKSEQLDTRLWLAVNEEKVAGLLLQIVPEVDPKNLVEEMGDTHWMRIIKKTSKVSTDDMLTNDYEALLEKLYPEEEIRIFPSTEVAFHCSCSRKRGEDAILLLGRAEAEAELKNNRTIVVTCDFCNREYVFDNADVAHIFENKETPPSNIHLH